MLNCTYTKDKVKKTKIWKDGFLALKDKRIVLYDEDKKQIYSFIYKNLGEEIITPVFLICCEELTKPSEENESDSKNESEIEEIPVKNEISITQINNNKENLHGKQITIRKRILHSKHSECKQNEERTKIVQKHVKRNSNTPEFTKRSKHEIYSLLNSSQFNKK